MNKQEARCWQELMNNVNKESWGFEYRLIIKKFAAHRSPCSMEAAKVGVNMQTFFSDAVDEGRSIKKCSPFTIKQLEKTSSP